MPQCNPRMGDTAADGFNVPMLLFFPRCLAVLLLSASAVFAAEPARIAIDLIQPGPAINPRMYGIFLEEINHGVDGGLYAELIRNRGFEDARPPEGYTYTERNCRGAWRDTHGFDAGFSRYGYTTNGAPFWSLVQEGSASGSMHLETTDGITAESAYCLRLDIASTTGGRVGVANGGFFGIGVKRGESYALSLYAKAGAGLAGPLTARLEDSTGEAISTGAAFQRLGTNWKQFQATLKADRTDPKARLVITVGAPGRVWLDFVSLFPKQTWQGQRNGLRPDLARMIADLKPGFVRFPGGCVVEGGTVETAYDWKLTLGPVEQRQERWGPWNYRRTQGMGLFEYLRFCEDLKAAPLWVGFVGQTCIFREKEHVPMAEMGRVRDNFLDLIEYANGPQDSRWGAQRVLAGHRNSYDLNLVEIGNENQGPELEERYRFVHEALKAKYPQLTFLADLSWTSRESMRNAQFDIEDQHYYSSPRWFQSRFHLYDDRDRKLPPLYLGEVAVTSNEGGPTRGNLRAALAEGVFLLGCERNADAVRMVSYAPLLGHVEGRTELTGAPPPWHAMIYFDGTRAFGTVSYHLWKLFGLNVPSHTVRTDVSFPGAQPVTVAGQIGLGTWASTAEFKDVRVERDGRVLYSSDFAKGTEGWRAQGGRWTVQEGAYRQAREGQGFADLGEESWADYTLTLKARKLAGGEGFLIVFGRKGADRYWWNLGGWGNSQHAIECNQNLVGQPVRGRIEDNRWYDIQVQVSGRRIRCHLDGELVHDATAPEPTTFYVVAGQDTQSGELVVKAINTGTEPVRANLETLGAKRIAAQGEVTVLTAASLTDNNTLEQPLKVQPITSRLKGAAASFTHEFPPHSLTVLRLKAR